MSNTRILIAILVMASVTYLIRVLPLVIFRKKIQNRFLQSFLYYMPYAVLAAMTIPEILYATADIRSGFAGFLAALFLAFRKQSLLVVALGAVSVVYVAEIILL